MRKPDFIITKAGKEDDPYLLRWWVIPRNPWFNIYLHKILRSDDDRALHDHPWWNLSILLRGGYTEIVPGRAPGHAQHWFKRDGRWMTAIPRRVGSVVFRLARAAHRLEVCAGRPCWTLFITGPRFRAWGFHCPRGWVLWRNFVDDVAPGSIGRGCGEYA